MRSGQTTDMRGLQAIDLPPWSLPLIVIALVVPVSAAIAALGPIAGLAVGFLETATVAALAIRARYDEAIEVAPSPDSSHRALIVCLAPLATDADAARVAALLAGAAEGFSDSAASLVLVPARNRPLAEWLSDVDQAREEAEQRLASALPRLRAAGIEAEGRVGETDVVQTVEDTLRSFPARDVIVVADETNASHELGELRRRLDRPVHELRIRRSASPLV